jgi:hypothetical protein
MSDIQVSPARVSRGPRKIVIDPVTRVDPMCLPHIILSLGQAGLKFSKFGNGFIDPCDRFVSISRQHTRSLLLAVLGIFHYRLVDGRVL